MKMSKLTVCFGQDTFNLEINHITKNEESKWRYWNYTLHNNDEETARLVRYLGYYRFQEIPFRYSEISITEEDTKGFFGKDKTVTKYTFNIGASKRKIHPKSIYLEE